MATQSTRHDTPAEGVGLLTYVAARFEAQREYMDERHGRLEDRLAAGERTRERDHAQLMDAVKDVSGGIGLLRDRLDKDVGALDGRVDELESVRDKHFGGMAALKQSLTTGVALVGGTAGIASLLHLFG